MNNISEGKVYLGMEIKEILHNIAAELNNCFQDLEESQLQELEKRIKQANKIFVAGAGRSLMMIRGLAMRLMHMGFQSYVVGETVTPAIEPGDLLIIASGSGSTGSLIVMAEKCINIGAALALITANPDSPIGKRADHIVYVPTATSKITESSRKTFQPGGNTFEQSVLLISDAIIMDIISGTDLEENNKVLMKKHANLE